MPALFLIFLQTFYLDFFGIGIDEGLSRFHRGLDARIVPAHDLVVFIALVRPDNHAVGVFLLISSILRQRTESMNCLK